MIQRTPLWSILSFLALVTLTRSVTACPFCSPSESDIVTEFARAKAVVRVEKVESGKFKIVEVLRGKAQQGKVVLAGEGRDFAPLKEPTLVLATESNPSQPYWSSRVKRLSGEEYRFVRRALAVDAEQKLDLAARNLLSSSKVISEASYNLLAPAPLKAVQKRIGLVGRENLVSALSDPAVPGVKKALYTVMLLDSLGAQDLAWVEKLLFKPPLNPYAVHLPPLMVAYAEIGGPDAVKKMETAFLAPEASTSATFAATTGFTYIGSNSLASPTRQAARQALYRELSYPERGYFVIAPLAEWRDFEPADRVEALAEIHTNKPRVIRNVIRYFRGFDRPEAKAALARLEKKFPVLVEQTRKPFPESKNSKLR